MNELTLIQTETLPGNLTVAEVDATMAYAEAEKAPSTRLAYSADWRHFSIWCLSRGATALPAHQGIVAAYLSSLAATGKKAATIGRRAAAIAHYHRQAGHDAPTNAAGVKATMRGIRRTIGTAKAKKTAATADIVMRMLAQCDDSLIGRRDRALIAVGMAGAFRRSELVALTTDDVEHTKEGLLITIRRSKGDQEGAGQVVSLPHGHHIRPCEALEGWLTAAGIAGSGQPLFRSVALGGRLGGPLTGDVVARVVKKLVARAGLEGADFSAHSLRSGFLSSAAEHRADVFAMQRQSRHKNLQVLAGYIQSKSLFIGHAGAGFL
jgi:site-specific recombinase XerD